MPASMQLSRKELFGGAIEADVPAHFMDASELRQVPDTQEVFLSPNDDTSIIFEILDVVTDGRAGMDLWEAVKFHFDALAHDNSALSSTITTSPPASPENSTALPAYTTTSPQTLLHPHLPTPSPMLISGTQSVRKFSSNRPLSEQPPPDEVLIILALWRVVLPCKDQPGKGRKADVVASVNVNLSEDKGEDGKPTGKVDVEAVKEWFGKVAESLRIMDYGLFVES